MLSETRKLLASRAMGSASLEDVVAWAISMLEVGLDAKNLCILASLSKPLNPFEVEDYFERTFKELGWTFPKREEILRLYACDVAESIVSSLLPPIEGCREMYRIVRALDYSDLTEWISLDDDIDRAVWEHRGLSEIEDVIRNEAKEFMKSCRVRSNSTPNNSLNRSAS